MNVVGIIPARMNSSRFPGKPLAPICGLPMIQHVYERSKLSENLKGVYVATCDKEIKEACEAFKTYAIMTSDRHERASDRVAEAMLAIEKQRGEHIDVIVMIQGDEPMLLPQMIDESVGPILNDKETVVTNLMSPITVKEEQEDKNEVKVVVDKNSNALYFSREPIPSPSRASNSVKMYKQVCLISFRRDFLLKFNSLPQTTLEKCESVDMLRCLEHGINVKMVQSQYETYSVDTKEDLAKVERLMTDDSLLAGYQK